MPYDSVTTAGATAVPTRTLGASGAWTGFALEGRKCDPSAINRCISICTPSLESGCLVQFTARQDRASHETFAPVVLPGEETDARPANCVAVRPQPFLRDVHVRDNAPLLLPLVTPEWLPMSDATTRLALGRIRDVLDRTFRPLPEWRVDRESGAPPCTSPPLWQSRYDERSRS
jgi:hypothetical protein